MCYSHYILRRKSQFTQFIKSKRPGKFTIFIINFVIERSLYRCGFFMSSNHRIYQNNSLIKKYVPRVDKCFNGMSAKGLRYKAETWSNKKLLSFYDDHHYVRLFFEGLIIVIVIRSGPPRAGVQIVPRTRELHRRGAMSPRSFQYF